MNRATDHPRPPGRDAARSHEAPAAQGAGDPVLPEALSEAILAYRRLDAPAPLTRRIRAAYAARREVPLSARRGGILAGAVAAAALVLAVTLAPWRPDGAPAGVGHSGPAVLSLGRLETVAGPQLARLAALDPPVALARLSPSRLRVPSLNRIAPGSYSDYHSSEETPES